MTDQLPLPTRYLARFNRENPGAWEYLDREREKRAFDRPPNVFSTMEECVYAAARYHKDRGLPREDGAIIARLHDVMVLGAWRLGQDVYRFQPTLRRALLDTEGLDELPPSALDHLPAFALYVEAPELTWDGTPYDGFFAMTGWSSAKGVAHPLLTLTFLRDAGDVITPRSTMLPLEGQSISEAFSQTHRTKGEGTGALSPVDLLGELMFSEDNLTTLRRAVSLLVYLGSEPEFEDFRTERQPVALKRVRGVARAFPAERVTTWEVGVRIGAALDRAHRQRQSDEESARRDGRKLPHPRKAHWQRYYYGRRDRRLREVRIRWKAPIIVNAAMIESFDRMPTVIHPVDVKGAQ